MKNIFSTDESVKNIIFTYKSVKRKITDPVIENFTDSDLESINIWLLGEKKIFRKFKLIKFTIWGLFWLYVACVRTRTKSASEHLLDLLPLSNTYYIYVHSLHH